MGHWGCWLQHLGMCPSGVLRLWFSWAPLPPGLCSEACLLRASHWDSPPLLRASSAGKNRLPVPKKVTQRLSKAATRSLGDLKVCRSTRGLVARFLQRSKRNLAPGMEMAGHSSQGHKQVGATSQSHSPLQPSGLNVGREPGSPEPFII